MRIVAFFLWLNLVFCEVRKDEIEMKVENNCSIQDLLSLQFTSSISQELSEKPLYSSNCSYSINNSNLCIVCNDGLSKCGHIPHDILQCRSQGNISVLDCHCITYSESEKESQAEIGNCVYNCINKRRSEFTDPMYHTLPKNTSDSNEVLCGKEFFRDGTLCGKCKDGYFPQVYSFNLTCVKCPHGRANWWKFVLIAFLPLTIFYFIVVFFKINASSPNLYGIIGYSQAMTMPGLARLITLSLRNHPTYLTGWKFVGSLYGIWNLDFFRAFDLGICLGTDTLQTLSLDIAVGIYPLMLMVLSYVLIDLYDRNFRLLVILWKPFRKVFGLFRRNWEIRTSVIDAFSTFFLLSNIKLLSVSFDLLIPVKVYRLSSSKGFHHSWWLFFDATIPYFKEKHLPYAILAIVMLFVFVFIPVVLLILYPFRWFQKLLNIFPFRWYILHTFMDSFYGCYKNGTQPGTRDCRWFASLFYILRFLFFIIALFTLNSMFFIFCSMCLILFAILLLNIDPFKADLSRYSDINIFFILLLASWCVSMTGVNIAILLQYDAMFVYFILAGIFGVLPIFYVPAIITYWMFSHRKFAFEFVRRIQALRQGCDWWSLE